MNKVCWYNTKEGILNSTPFHLYLYEDGKWKNYKQSNIYVPDTLYSFSGFQTFLRARDLRYELVYTIFACTCTKALTLLGLELTEDNYRYRLEDRNKTLPGSVLSKYCKEIIEKYNIPNEGFTFIDVEEVLV